MRPLSADFSLWAPACALKIEGPDAFDFLQGQFSNDLRRLSVGGGAVYGLWLERKGHVLGDAFILRSGDETFWAISYETPDTLLRMHLERFIIADDVTLSDQTSQISGVSLFSASAEAEAALRQEVMEMGYLVFSGRRAATPNLEWLGSESARQSLIARLSPTRQLCAEEMEHRRIAAAIPSVPRDLGERELPQEGGAWFEAAAVSYNKGCYLGQEVMARLRSRGGRVRRQLLAVTGSGSVPDTLPSLLYSSEKQVGELRSAVPVKNGGGFIGLALIALSKLAEGGERVALSQHPNGPENVRLSKTRPPKPP